MPVFHVSNAPAGALYVGRPSRWGNPFVLRRESERAECLERYRSWLWEEIASGRLPLADLAALEGRDLACYCAPSPCHGDVLAAAASWAATELQETGA